MISSLSVLGQMDSAKLFESSKGKWPTPVSRFFKIYENENLKHFASNQFDSTLRIITDSSYQVKAVHDATVTAIIEVDGEYTVLTNFGNYYISYSRLTRPNLVKGEYIKAGQQLGQVMKDWTENNYTLEIALSKGTKQLNAEDWIDW
jgi:murein hydrolase activator